jgi:hypothetical protein
MELTPLTKEQAEHLATSFKQLEHKHIFQVPGTMDPLMVTHVTVAPFKGPAQDDFRYNFQTGFDLEDLVKRYRGDNYTVLIIANILSVGNIILTQPYFFDIRYLHDIKIKDFNIFA